MANIDQPLAIRKTTQASAQAKTGLAQLSPVPISALPTPNIEGIGLTVHLHSPRRPKRVPRARAGRANILSH